MGELNIEGIRVTPLKIIHGDLGSIMHALKNDEASYASFGEAYFSTVKKGVVKGWKRHTRMTLNIVVPVGAIRFVVYDDREGSATINKLWEITLSTENYQRLTVSPGLWMAFEGKADGTNLLLNIASIKHDPSEAEQADLYEPKMKYPFANAV
jgi:dTDP-4-dehydrorhamnose 3,5-epimerase